MARPLKVAFALYAVAVAIAVLLAYPKLFSREAGRNPWLLAERPRPAVMTTARALTDALPGPITSEYRGSPRRSGVTPEVMSLALESAFEGRPNNVGIHGAAKSSPAVDDTGIYVGSDGSWFSAYDLEGALRWRLEIANAPFGVHGTALLDEHRAYIGAYNGRFYALNKANGELLWATQLGETIGSSAASIDGDLLVSVEQNSPPNGFVARLDRLSGAVRWTSEWLGEQTHSSPTVVKEQGLMLVGANNSLFFGLELATGAERWRTQLDAPAKGTACLLGGRFFFMSRIGTVYAADIATGQISWHHKLGTDSRASAVCLESLGLVVTASSQIDAKPGVATLYAFDAETGAQRWAVPGGPHNAASSPMATGPDAEGRFMVWARCSANQVCALDAVSGATLGTYDVGGALSGVPVIYKGSLYLSLNAPGGVVKLSPKVASTQ